MRWPPTLLAPLALASLVTGCTDPDAPRASYTGALRIVHTAHDPAKKVPFSPSADTTFTFKVDGELADLGFGACKVTFERPKARSDRFKWPVKKGGPCPTSMGAATIRAGDFVVYPDGGLMLTLTGATDDGAFDVEWSTIVGSKPGAP